MPMALTEVTFYIETEGIVAPQEIADAVGTLLERNALPYKKPAYVLAKPTDFLDIAEDVYILKGSPFLRPR